MAYCRWGESDVYMYECVMGGWVCHGTSMAKPPVSLATIEETIAHMEAHEAAGHDVGDALNRLRTKRRNASSRSTATPPTSATTSRRWPSSAGGGRACGTPRRGGCGGRCRR